MSDEVVYLLGPARFAERIAVSAYSLRRHFSGDITLFATDDESAEVGGRIMAAVGGRVSRRAPSRRPRHTHYATKTCVPLWATGGRTVFLDGDTLVVGSIAPLFEAPLTVTRFADWKTNGRRMGGRIRGWAGVSGILDRWIAELTADAYPALNTGVLGWHRDGVPGWGRLWNEVTLAGPAFIADEIAMQLIFNRVGAIVLDDRFNCSPLYGAGRADVRVWHFHGDKHLRKEAGAALWWPVFMEAWEAGFAGLRRWAGRYDPWVRSRLPLLGAVTTSV
jgi:hypothetical protein